MQHQHQITEQVIRRNDTGPQVAEVDIGNIFNEAWELRYDDEHIKTLKGLVGGLPFCVTMYDRQMSTLSRRIEMETLARRNIFESN